MSAKEKQPPHVADMSSNFSLDKFQEIKAENEQLKDILTRMRNKVVEMKDQFQQEKQLIYEKTK